MYFSSLRLSKVPYGLLLLSLPALPGNSRQGFDLGLWLLALGAYQVGQQPSYLHVPGLQAKVYVFPLECSKEK